MGLRFAGKQQCSPVGSQIRKNRTCLVGAFASFRRASSWTWSNCALSNANLPMKQCGPRTCWVNRVVQILLVYCVVVPGGLWCVLHTSALHKLTVRNRFSSEPDSQFFSPCTEMYKNVYNISWIYVQKCTRNVQTMCPKMYKRKTVHCTV